MRCVAAALLVAATMVIPQPAQAQDDTDTRPALPTFWGDTGLWFVPTADVPRSGGVTFSVYRSEFGFNQGFTNVSFFPATLSVGIADRLEVFGALRTVTRIDRDARPLFYAAPPADGGVLNQYPFVREIWTGNDLGDLHAGAKLNVLSQYRDQPVSLAVRVTLKVPTADSESGAGTGELDYFGDLILSREIGSGIEFTGFGGAALRGDPGPYDLSDSFRWGVGAGFGTRRSVRFTAELLGEAPFNDNVVTNGPLTGADGSVQPTLSKLDSSVMTNLGITWQHPSGIALGAGMSYRFGTDARSDIFPEFDDRWLDALGWQFRLAYHPGVRLPRAPAPPPPAPPAPRPAPPAAAAPAPPPPAVVANRPPTVRVQCDPCRVNVGQSLALQADGQDPDGDRLTFRWSTPAGVIADPLSAATRWTATTVPGSLVLTVTGDDGRGGLATGSVTIEVVGAQPTAFDDIRFDYDQTALRPEALAVLQQVVAALRANPAMRLRIEGHASAEGTAEYNLALGERRAVAVRDYISSQGIDAARLATVTYGEERPRYDNAIEGNRALNRRAAFVVLAQ